MNTQDFEKIWERESGLQPGMVLEVLSLYDVHIPKLRH